MLPLPRIIPHSTGSDNGHLNVIRDIRFGVHQEVSGNSDDAFVGTATCCRRQLGRGGVRDVNANDGKVTGFQFKHVGTMTERNRLRAVRVRVRPKPPEEHMVRIHNSCDLFTVVFALQPLVSCERTKIRKARAT